MRTLRTIATPWAPYAVMFSRDGTRITTSSRRPGPRVSASGNLCVFDPSPETSEPIDAWQLPEPATPRSLAADPDGRYLAVGVKQGGAGDPASVVSLVEIRPRTIDPAWRTPAVRAMARAVADQRTSSGTLDVETLRVLTDALEQAGCVAQLSHLRHHDPRLRTCGIVDAC